MKQMNTFFVSVNHNYGIWDVALAHVFYVLLIQIRIARCLLSFRHCATELTPR